MVFYQKQPPTITSLRVGATMLKRVLREFLSIEKVTTAALIGSDGFVIEIAATGETDIDAIGALCSCAVKYFIQDGEELGMGIPRQIVLEYQDGFIILVPLTAGEFIAVITDSADHLARLKYCIERSNARVAALI